MAAPPSGGRGSVIRGSLRGETTAGSIGLGAVDVACDEVADVFGDVGDDGVAEGAQSVHPVGKPINHSTHWGFSSPRAVGSARSTAACRSPRSLGRGRP